MAFLCYIICISDYILAKAIIGDLEAEMAEKQKTWVKPQLIVLGRSTPEESVLYTCKQILYLQGPLVSVGCFVDFIPCRTQANS